MATFHISARKTSPLTPVTVDADLRELAILSVVNTAAEGEQIEVLSCFEAAPGEAAPTGTTGVSRRG